MNKAISTPASTGTLMVSEPWNVYSRLIRPRAPPFGAAIAAIGIRQAAIVVRMEAFMVAVCASALSCALGSNFESILMMEDGAFDYCGYRSTLYANEPLLYATDPLTI